MGCVIRVSWVPVDALLVGESRATLLGVQSIQSCCPPTAQASLPRTQDIGVTVTKGIALLRVIQNRTVETGQEPPNHPE